MLTLLIAGIRHGLRGRGVPAGAQSAAPGSYAHRPRAVDSSTITEPVSCMVVTSASQNSAFRIPTTCLAYPKAAIEQGNYAGYLTCDANSTPHGKTFATTKNSQAGQEKEIDSFLADYFTSVCGAAPNRRDRYPFRPQQRRQRAARPRQRLENGDQRD